MEDTPIKCVKSNPWLPITPKPEIDYENFETEFISTLKTLVQKIRTGKATI